MSLLHRLAARAGHPGIRATNLRPKTMGAPALARMEAEDEAQPLTRMEDEDAKPLRRMEEEETQPLRRSEEDEAQPLSRMEEDEAQPLARMEDEEAAQPLARTEEEDAQPMMRMEEEDAAQSLRRMEEEEAQPLARIEDEEAAQPLARTEDEDAQPMMRMEEEDAAQPLRRSEEEEAQPLARMEEDEAQPLTRMQDEEAQPLARTEEDEAAPLARMAPPDGDALEAGNSEMPEAMSGLPDDIGAADAMAVRRDMTPAPQAFGSDAFQSGGLADIAQDPAGLDTSDAGFFDLGDGEPGSDPTAAISAAIPERAAEGPTKVQIDQIDVTVLEPTAPAQGATRDVAQEFSNFARRRFLGGL